MHLSIELSPRPDRTTSRSVTRKVRKLRAPLFRNKPDDCVAPARFPQSIKDLAWMDDCDLTDLLENADALDSAVSRITDLGFSDKDRPYAASAYHSVGGIPAPSLDDVSAWTSDDRGLTFTASFPARSTLFHCSRVPVLAVCGFKEFCPTDRLVAAQALEWLAEREARSVAEMAHFRKVRNKRLGLEIVTLHRSYEAISDAPDMRQYQKSLTCPVIAVSLANPKRWTISICDGETANHDLFVDWIDGRLVSISTAYRDDAELKDVSPPALPTYFLTA